MATDRRVAYTKKTIRESFYKLLQEKPLRKITVKELCLEADVNRATFYRYYEDVHDLFKKLEQEIIGDVFRLNCNESLEEGRIRELTLIRDNRYFYQELIQSHMESIYLNQIMERQKLEMIQHLKEKNVYDEASFLYRYQYIVSGSIGMIQKWIEGGCKESPEVFAQIILSIQNDCS